MASKGEESEHRLFVTKIAPQLTKEEIAAHFAQFGTTTDVYMPSFFGRPGHKGIAFISYSDATALQTAVNQQPHVVSGQEVVVDVAAPRGTAVGKGGKGAGAPTLAQALDASQGGQEQQTQEQAQGENRLFVTKVAPTLTQEHMAQYFSQFGEMTDCYMPTNPVTGTHKGICFVSFADASAPQMALAQASHEVQGQPFVVDVAAPREAKGKGKGKKGWDKGFDKGFEKGLSKGFGKSSGKYDAYGGASYGGSFGGYQQSYAPAYTPSYAQAAPAAASSARLFVTKIPFEVTTEDLQLYFQQFGQLEDVYMPHGKGIAFVSFQDPSVSKWVLETQQHLVKPGVAVVVDQATEKGDSKGKGKGFGKSYGKDYGKDYGQWGKGKGYAPY